MDDVVVDSVVAHQEQESKSLVPKIERFRAWIKGKQIENEMKVILDDHCI